MLAEHIHTRTQKGSPQHYTYNQWTGEHTAEEGRNIRQIDPHKQRVTQTNMVYLIGLPEEIADEQLLASYEFCGQYGPIIKVLVKKTYFNDYASFSAYVTYAADQAASLAILGINNLVYNKARIYASYGTNKYCSTYLRFGRCRKAECPFSHRIEQHKEIKEGDNKKLFQDQQLLAKSFVVRNFTSLHISEQISSGAFPSRYQVVQSLINDGSITLNLSKTVSTDQDNDVSRQFCERSNALLKEKSLARSDISTEGSPEKSIEQEILLHSPSLISIIPKIRRKLELSAKSILGFHSGQQVAAESMTKLLLSSLQV